MHSFTTLAVLLTTSAVLLVPDRQPSWSPELAVPSTPFEAMLKEIRTAKVSGDWKQAGWQPKSLQQDLTRIVAQIRTATKDDAVALPIQFADAKPVEGRRDLNANDFVVGADFDFGSTFKSIILADGNVKIGFADECVIIARGAVYIAHGQGNVIIAGQAVHTSHDGNQGRAGQGKGSIILANAWLDVSHSHNGGIYSAPDLEVSFANATTILNPRKMTIGNKMRYAEAIAKDLRVFPPPANPLEKGLTLAKLDYKDDWALSRASFTDADNREFVVGIGNDFAGNGRARPELAGWRVTMISSSFVVLSNGIQDACFSKTRRQP